MKMKYFDMVAETRFLDPDEAEHQLRIAFGPKRNQGKALLKWTPEERKFRNFTVQPNTWYGRGRSKDYVDKLCARAEEVGDIYIRIISARK
jgi:hypothetical protein